MKTLRFAALTAALLSPAAATAQDCEYPGVLLIVDRSVSMQRDSGDSTMWEVARGGVLAMVDRYAEEMDLGLMIYPGPSGRGADGRDWADGVCRWDGEEDVCTDSAPRCTPGDVVVDVGRNDRLDFEPHLTWPDGYGHAYTPTWQSLQAALEYPLLRRPDRRNYAVLVTDGWQCCGLYPEGDGYQCEEFGREPQVERVRALRDAGITTFVMGFGGSVDSETLNRMAVEAGTHLAGCVAPGAAPDANARCYVHVDDRDELFAALEDIGRRIAEEICDGLDNDCDGRIDEELVRACRTACGPGEEVCLNGQWAACDGPQPQGEECNGEDDDCDGRADEDIVRACATACGIGTERCEHGVFVDCDAPQPDEEVCDGRDNDCDNVVDPDCDCSAGDRRPCGEDEGACQRGTQVCLNDGSWAARCDGGVGPVAEVCDGEDNDCDGEVDGLERSCQTACGRGEERCEDGAWVGCDVPEPSPEECNGDDDDCDGEVDEALVRACATECGDGVEVCDGGAWGACSARAPEAEEVCGNGVDDDCDEQGDEGCDCEDGATQPCGSDRGVCEAGVQTCEGDDWGDCEGAVYGEEEACNGRDDNCNGAVDEGDVCPPGETCLCGGCFGPCLDGECGEGTVCLRGTCVADICPEGMVCDEGVCIPAEGRLPGHGGIPRGEGEGEGEGGGLGPDGERPGGPDSEGGGGGGLYGDLDELDDSGLAVRGTGLVTAEACACSAGASGSSLWGVLAGLFGLAVWRRSR